MGQETRIAMWSGPRNISTAMMYSFDNRQDCHVTDEPLYASFLSETKTPHPVARKVIETYENDEKKVISELNGPIPGGKSIWYQKHMCHHVIDWSDLTWMDGFHNCFLIRDPREVLLSLRKITNAINLEATGLPQQIRIFEYVNAISNSNPIVIDSKSVLEDPRSVLSSLCRLLGIDFSEKMLSWDPGPRKCDGVWAKYWYESVWNSSGFESYSPPEGELDRETELVLDEAIPLYEKLKGLIHKT